ncbi:MAG: DUF5711 family protein [Clostridia bacterium]|nr:DUF5711 family protein [Clostridia bacterium]
MADDRDRVTFSERISGWGRSIASRLRTWAGRLPLPEDGAEPIDLSAPSIPYYTNLSRRFSLASLLLFLLTFVFVVVALISSRSTLTYANLYYLVKDINASALTVQAQADRMEYPVSVSTPAFTRYRGGLVSVGSEEVSVLSSSGKQTLSVNVSYGTPAVAASDKYFITYGRGECSFSVFNAFSQIRNETTEFPVYGAAVADDGSFAILTRSKLYTSEALFYDKDMNKVADYHLNGYVTFLSLNPSGTNAVLTSVEDVDGQWVSTVVLIRLSGRITAETVSVKGAFAGVCGFMADDRAAVVYTDRLQVLRTDGTVIADEVISDRDITLCAVADGRTALVTEDSRSVPARQVLVYDKNGRSVYKADLDIQAEPTSASFGGNMLFIRAGASLYRLSADGTELSRAPINREAVAVLPSSDGSVLICGTAFATRLDAKEFPAS